MPFDEDVVRARQVSSTHECMLYTCMQKVMRVRMTELTEAIIYLVLIISAVTIAKFFEVRVVTFLKIYRPITEFTPNPARSKLLIYYRPVIQLHSHRTKSIMKLQSKYYHMVRSALIKVIYIIRSSFRSSTHVRAA